MAVARVVRAFRPALRCLRNSWLQPLRSKTSAAEAIFVRAPGRGPEGPHYPYERIHQSWNRYKSRHFSCRWYGSAILALPSEDSREPQDSPAFILFRRRNRSEEHTSELQSL